MFRSVLAAGSCAIAYAVSDLCIAENGGHGEDPPPIGDLIRVDTTSGAKTVIAKGMEDPVWVAVRDGFAYVGLFHAGNITQVNLGTGATRTIATGLSCPEGIGLDQDSLYVVENPIGNECRQDVRKPAAQLTRVNISSGEQAMVAPLNEPHGMDIEAGSAYICERGAHQLTRVDLMSGQKAHIAALEDPSGCAVGGGYAYAIEEGAVGSLVKIGLESGEKTTLIDDLSGPMGVVVDPSVGYVYAGERGANQVRRVPISGGTSDVLVASLNSNIGMALCPSTSSLSVEV